MLAAIGPCVITFHQWRARKCGPGFALAAFRCAAHACFFTAYPDSWLPFGRRPMVVVMPSGLDVSGMDSSTKSWIETAFGAAVDAESGSFWPKSASEHREWSIRFGREAYGVKRTQARHVIGINRLFAFDGDLVSEQPRVAASLGVDLADIVTITQRARDGPALRAAGEKGVGLLNTIGLPCRRILPGFIRLGSDRRYWGPMMPNISHVRHRL